MWAFGVSPQGLGLAEDAFWSLCEREYYALRKQFETSREFQISLVAAVRADIHNTAGKSFDRTFEPADFMPGAKTSIEDRARELMAQGMAPAAAVAMASSKQSREHKIFIVRSTMEASGKKKSGRQKPKVG